MGSELIRDHAIGEPRTIGKPTFYGPGRLRGAHVYSENDTTAFFRAGCPASFLRRFCFPRPFTAAFARSTHKPREAFRGSLPSFSPVLQKSVPD